MAMKVVHCSDWHLGAGLHGFDRLEEYRAALMDVAETVGVEQPDAVIVAGDVFDTAQPSAAAQNVFAEVIMRMHCLAPDAMIVITAGNHDSASRHEVFRLPWRLANVITVGVIPPADVFDAVAAKLIIPVPGKGFVVALPYAGRRLNSEPDLPSRLLERVAAMNPDGLPVVMTAHLPVRKADFTGHSRYDDDTLVGNVETIPLSSLGTGYDYLALGHIHGCQRLDAEGRVWYSGTPIHTSFDEKGPRCLLIADIPAHGAIPDVMVHPIPSPAELISLPETGTATFPEALAMLAALDDSCTAYVRLNVTQPEPLPSDAEATARRTAASKACRFCGIVYTRQADNDETDSDVAMSVNDFVSADPMDIARRYYSLRGFDFNDETRTMISSILDELRNSDPE